MAQGTGPTVHGIQKISVAIEPAGSFATEIVWPSGGTADFSDLPIVEGSASWTTDLQMLDPGHLVQYHDDYREEIAGKKSWTLTFTLPLAPTGVAAVAAVTAVEHAVGKLLKVCMGGQATLASGSTATGGGTSSAFDVAAATGKFTAGMCASWVNASSVYQMREIQTVSGVTITTKLAGTAAPGTSAVIHNAATYYLAADPTTSLQFVVQGMEQGDRWLLKGGQGGFTVSLPLDGSIPTITFNITGTTWVQVSDASGTAMKALEGVDLSVATYTSFAPIAGFAGDLRMPILGTASLTAATLVHCSALSFEPQVAYAPITSPSGDQGVLRWRRTRAAPIVSGSFTTYYETDARWLARAAKTDYALFYQIGQTAGSSILISAPTIQIVNVQRADDNGIAGETVTWKARADGDITASGPADQQRSPLRIHFG